MILYTNGDSHTAAAEAVNPHAFAEDDPRLVYLKRLPHPDNLAVSWGKTLADNIKGSFHCDAESAASNYRILRTTRSWIERNQKDWHRTLMIIQWSTWEREEWPYEGDYLQVNASGVDHVPESLQQRYREFIANVDWREKTQHWHQQIWQLHQELLDKNIAHVFFNGDSDFSKIKDQQDWGLNYIGPYDPKHTYSAVIKSAGIETVAPNSYHFGRQGHSFFARFMLKYCIDNKLL
jgi:hypothetical protein